MLSKQYRGGGGEIQKLYAEIDWDTLPSNLPDIIQVKEKIKHIKETYKLDL